MIAIIVCYMSSALNGQSIEIEPLYAPEVMEIKTATDEHKASIKVCDRFFGPYDALGPDPDPASVLDGIMLDKNDFFQLHLRLDR